MRMHDLGANGLPSIQMVTGPLSATRRAARGDGADAMRFDRHDNARADRVPMLGDVR